MRTSNERHLIRRLAFVLCALLTGAPAAASNQDGHAGHNHAAHKAAQKHAVELGTSAAVDRSGRLWIVGKEVVQGDQFVTVKMSADFGKTWSVPKRIQAVPEPISADGENRPKIAFGTKGELYVTYTKPLAKPYTGEIRLVRSLDGGESFLPPITVHANRDMITHRFDSLIVDNAGRIFVAWIDKRDLENARIDNRKYRGAAIYYSVSDDGGASFKGDFKIADHSCECCRIALALAPDGKVRAMWRHVFEPNIRDHALAILGTDGRSSVPERVTFENWKIDACPHHGPSIAFDSSGKRYQTWFNVQQDEGSVYLAAAEAGQALGKPVVLGTPQSEHPVVAVNGTDVVVAWKQFDGKSTAIIARVSPDRGKTWKESELARTNGRSDQPRLVSSSGGILVVWRTENEDVRILRVAGRMPS